MTSPCGYGSVSDTGGGGGIDPGADACAAAESERDAALQLRANCAAGEEGRAPATATVRVHARPCACVCVFFPRDTIGGGLTGRYGAQKRDLMIHYCMKRFVEVTNKHDSMFRFCHVAF